VLSTITLTLKPTWLLSAPLPGVISDRGALSMGGLSENLTDVKHHNPNPGVVFQVVLKFILKNMIRFFNGTLISFAVKC